MRVRTMWKRGDEDPTNAAWQALGAEGELLPCCGARDRSHPDLALRLLSCTWPEGHEYEMHVATDGDTVLHAWIDGYVTDTYDVNRPDYFELQIAEEERR